MMFVTTRQAFELGRIADRCGTVGVRPLARGCVAVVLSTSAAAGTFRELAVNADGRVIDHRRIRREVA